MCDIGTPGANALAKASFMPNLRHLDISLNHIDVDGLRAVIRATENLEQLDLSVNRLDPDELAALIDHDGLQSLVALELRHNKIGDRGLSALVSAEHLQNLRRLNLAANGISAAGVAELVGSPLMPNLRELDLSDNAIGDQGAEALASAPSTRALRVLDLERTRIGDPGAQAIAQSENLAGLVDLQLGLNEIGDAGAVALADSEHSRGLQELALTSNDQIGDVGAAALQASAHIPCDRVFAYPQVWCDGRIEPHKYKKSVELCERQSASGCAGAGYALMEGYVVTKDLQRAASYFARGCEMDHASSCNNQAWLRCHDLGHCDELAETHVRKALRLADKQDRPYFFDTLALILCQQGKKEEANEAYRRVCESDPDSDACGNSCR
jgi:tetratricopeptide (TPR) repeat protein